MRRNGLTAGDIDVVDIQDWRASLRKPFDDEEAYCAPIRRQARTGRPPRLVRAIACRFVGFVLLQEAKVPMMAGASCDVLLHAAPVQCAPDSALCCSGHSGAWSRHTPGDGAMSEELLSATSTKQQAEARTLPVRRRLLSQEHSRSQGVPVLTVMLDTNDALRRMWTAFYEERSAPTSVVATLLGGEVLRAAISRVRGNGQALERFAAWLAARSGRSVEDTAYVLSNGNAAERSVLASQAGLDAAEQALLQGLAAIDAAPGAPISEDMAYRALSTLVEAAGEDLLPAVLVDGSGLSTAQRLREEVDAFERLAGHLPRFRAGLVLPCQAGRALLKELAGTRAAALLTEGLVELPEQSRIETAEPGPEDEAAARDVIARALGGSVDARVMEAWRQAAAQQPPAGRWRRAAADGARSAVERFLFQILERHPLTRGRFRLNEYVDTRSGRLPRTEVDFLARAERIAIEVDGYFHFRDLDAYRHDRLKDLVLQQEGYTVARFLAEDVMGRLDVVLDTIICALESAGRREDGL